MHWERNVLIMVGDKAGIQSDEDVRLGVTNRLFHKPPYAGDQKPIEKKHMELDLLFPFHPASILVFMHQITVYLQR